MSTRFLRSADVASVDGPGVRDEIAETLHHAGAAARLAVLAYGLVAYAAFFVAILYAIGFLGNFGVPKTVDSGVPGATGTSVAVNLALMLLFAVQHAVMARPGFKKWWAQWVPRPLERSTFVLLASACLLLLFWQWRPLPGVVWHVEHSAIRTVLFALSMIGWATVFASSYMVSHADLFGLRQVYTYYCNRRYYPVGFRLVGLYKIVRHPLMLGFLIAFWCTPTMSAGHLLFAATTTVYILVGIKLEERDLITFLGDSYRDYRRRVPMLIPFLGGSQGRHHAQ